MPKRKLPRASAPVVIDGGVRELDVTPHPLASYDVLAGADKEDDAQA